MRNRQFIIFLGLVLLLSLVFGSCKETPEPRENTSIEGGVAGKEFPEQKESGYDPATVDEELAGAVAGKLREMFAAELGGMTEVDRRFELYKVNLDTDTEEEVFIRFMSPYFCGSGGCTLLLLDDDLSLITRFTVTRPPIFVEPTLKGEWKVLLVRSNKEWKELVNKGRGYPQNPTILPAAPYDAPSGNAEVVFGDGTPSLPAKTYGF